MLWVAILWCVLSCCWCQDDSQSPTPSPHIPHDHNSKLTPPEDFDYCQASTPEARRVQRHIDTGLTLAQVQVIVRHGDRTPIEWLGSPVYKDNAVWNCSVHKWSSYVVGDNVSAPMRMTYEKYTSHRMANPGNCRLGSLTHKGIHQHARIGQVLRKMYIETAKLLPETWDDDIVYVRSGDQLRLIESAQALLNGLYPPDTNSAHQKQQFELIDDAFDNMSPRIMDVCPRALKLKEEAQKSPEWQSVSAEVNALNSQLQGIFHAPVTVAGMADLIRTRACHQFDITFGGLLNEEIIHKVLNVSLNYFVMFPNDTASNRLGVGSFLWEITHHFQNFVEGKNKHKIVLYSGHDSSIWPLLNTLDIFDGAWPPLASQVIFEFWKNAAGEYFVEIVYNGRSLTKYKKGCRSGHLCPLAQFLKSVSKVSVSVDKFWKECDDMSS